MEMQRSVEPLMRRALAIDEKSSGLEHPDVARDLGNLAQLLQTTNRLDEAGRGRAGRRMTLSRSRGRAVRAPA
jgi:hypothetical protein